MGSELLVYHGNPAVIWQRIVAEYAIDTVFYDVDYEKYSVQRDAEIELLFDSAGIRTGVVHDHVIFHPETVNKDDGSPYSVFTPYSRKWMQRFVERPPSEFDSETGLAGSLLPMQAMPMPSFESLGFEYCEYATAESAIRLEIFDNYHQLRDRPDVDGTSRLSAALRFGILSPRKLVMLASQRSPAFLNELIWRDFYQMILFHFPHVEQGPFKPAYASIEWINNEFHFERWCRGETGYPLVDAAMHQLNETGWMHNRCRMITASFLCKHLLTDWRWGEAYFASKLTDFETASNNGGWQWAAGSGCDAVPYFRIFNPELQRKKFDPIGNYVKQWNVKTHTTPLVEHEFARRRCLETYKKALYGSQ